MKMNDFTDVAKTKPKQTQSQKGHPCCSAERCSGQVSIRFEELLPLLTPPRYQYLMSLKAKGELKYEVCKCPDGNFGRSWQTIFKKAGIENGTFHDLRSTCITEWLERGLMPHEARELTGHADINTTMNYYVGIRESLIDKARGASTAALSEDFSALSVRATQKGTNGKKQTTSITSQTLDLSGVTQT